MIRDVGKKAYPILFLILFFLGKTNCLNAQDRSSRFRFQHITVNDGLAHSDAMDVVQSRLGFIWIATNNGVDRYDGYDLKHYQLPVSQPTGVSSNRVQSLFVDTNGTLWVGTESAGVYFYDEKIDAFFRPLVVGSKGAVRGFDKELNRANVKSMAMDESHRLWIGTLNYGVFCVKADSHRQIASIEKVALGNISETTFWATSITVDKAGKIWVGTLGKGLWNLKSETKPYHGVYVYYKNNYISESDIRVVEKGKNNDIWVGSDNYVYRLSGNGDHDKIKLQKLDCRFYGIQALYSDSFGRFWIGTNFGLNMIEDIESYFARPNSQTIHQYTPQDSDPESINSGRIHQIMEDTFGNLWLAASSGGINKISLQSKGFHHISREVAGKTMLTNNFINAIARDDERNQLWIGTRNGYSVYNEPTNSYLNFLSRPAGANASGTDISAFCQIGNKMWIGTRYSGLFTAAIDGKQNPVAFGALPGVLPWSYVSIESIVTDTKKQVWVGTFGAGINLFTEEGRFVKNYNQKNSVLPTDDISFLLMDKVQGFLWVSTRDQGVLKLKEVNGELKLVNQFKHDPGNRNSLKVNFAWPLLKDKTGNIWVGTIGGGLHKIYLKDGMETVQRYQHLVSDNDIEGMLVDSQGNLWLAGAGLKKFNPTTGELVYFDVSDGLQSNSFKVGSSFMAANGAMYFGGTNGLTWFRPMEVRSNPLPPVMRITGLRVLNKNPESDSSRVGNSMVIRTVSDSEGVTIRADENDFLFEFVGLNYVNPEKQVYAFKMEGYNKDWTQLPKGQRTASFANLPAGDYVFKVKANNGEGKWSILPASVRVKVLPPWWQTWWAYTLYILTLSAALFWYRKLTRARLKLENKLALEKLNSDKNREMAEMRAAFFTGVSHEFRTPLTLIMGPMEEFVNTLSGSEAMRAKAVMMHKQTRKLLDLVNQLLSFRKVESGVVRLMAARQDILVFIHEIFSIFQIKADELGLEYRLTVPEAEIPIYFDAEKMEVVLTNLLSNAFKYSQPGGAIVLSAKIVGAPDNDAVWNGAFLVDNYIEISVTDTGKGIDEDDAKRIFDPYFQAANATSGITGSGIGLALVKEFVKAHTGEVVVESRIGVGSTFFVRLPFGKKHLQSQELLEQEEFVESTFNPEKAISDVETNSSLRAGSVKLLIVEDNVDLRLYLGGLFEERYQVILADNGADGWTKALEMLPDLVISDVNMPGMNGLDLSKKIKQNLKTTHIPVILLTARAAAVQALEGLETGADDYIVKPFNEEILKAKIGTILRNRNRVQEYYQRQILLQPTAVVIPDEERIFLETAMSIVEENLTNSDFNVQSLVSSMNMSQSVFYRRIKSITGQTVVEFIKDIRLKRAAQLLAAPNARVLEVAFMVGIEDPKNFRVSFQKRYHMSPSQYARSQRLQDVQKEDEDQVNDEYLPDGEI